MNYTHVAEVQLKYKPKPFHETVYYSQDLHRLLIGKVFDEDTIGHKESFKLLLLNNAHKVIGYSNIAEGGLTSTIVDVRLVMQTALVSNATAIVLAHNHPSGNTKPSWQDDEITSKIGKACKLFDIRLLDHIIVTPFDDYYSYCDNGKL